MEDDADVLIVQTAVTKSDLVVIFGEEKFEHIKGVIRSRKRNDIRCYDQRRKDNKE